MFQDRSHIVGTFAPNFHPPYTDASKAEIIDLILADGGEVWGQASREDPSELPHEENKVCMILTLTLTLTLTLPYPNRQADIGDDEFGAEVATCCTCE